jgi:hypothetical protein
MKIPVGALALLCAAAFCSLPLTAQPTPLGEAVRVNTFLPDDQFAPAVAATAEGAFFVVWVSAPGFGETAQDGDGAGVFGQAFDASGSPVGSEQAVNETTAGDQTIPAVAVTADGYVVVWRSRPPGADPSTSLARIFARLYDREGHPQGGEVQISPDSVLSDDQPAVTAAPDGGFTAVWATGMLDFFGLVDPHVFLRRFDSRGIPAGPAVQVDGDGFATAPGVGSDLEGRTLVVWTGPVEDASQGDDPQQVLEILGRRFDPSGQPVAAEFRVSQQPVSFNPKVSCNPGGTCAVAWESLLLAREVLVRRLPAGDGAAGAEILVARAISDFEAVLPSVAIDAAGGFIVAWTDSITIQAQRYDAAGRRQGPLYSPPDGFRSIFGGEVALAAAANGDFVVVYRDSVDPSLGLDVLARRFRIPPAGSDPCRFLPRGILQCDVLHDGGDAEYRLAVAGVRPGDVPLLGDLDRSRQDGICLYRLGRDGRTGHFLCDFFHNGQLDEDIAFGTRGDRPLLGDLNGDGRDDPCVRRGRRFLCDTAHNGGTAEVQIEFGLASDVPLLGDVDGDGDDDPCVFRDGLFLCDTAHDGAAAEVTIRFGQRGDVPFLVDADGDGRADPCVYRDGLFLCDTAHDGGAPEVTIRFGTPGVMPLFGNVNGI